MKKQTFSTAYVMATMAALKIIIKRLADVKKDGKGEYSTETVSALYGLSPEELSFYLGDSRLADMGDDGRMYFLPKLDPRMMGRYDEKHKTFMWSAIGFELVVTVMSDAGVYPGDLLIEPFIGRKSPEKVIEEVYPEHFNN